MHVIVCMLYREKEYGHLTICLVLVFLIQIEEFMFSSDTKTIIERNVGFIHLNTTG